MQNQTTENKVNESVKSVNTINATPQPQKTNNSLVFILSGLLLISLSLAGYFYYQLQKVNNNLRILNDELTQKQTQTTTPTTEPTATDETVNWKVFSFKNGVSFKYPQSLNIKIFDENSVGLYGSDEIHEFRINNYSIPQNESLYQFVYGGGAGDNYGKTYLDANNVKLTFKEESIISTYKVFNPSEWPSRGGIKIKFLQKDTVLVWFSLEPYNPGGTPVTNESEYSQTFDQILSTFKFIN